MDHRQESYWKVTLKNVSAKVEELISSLCFDYGASGVSEQLDFTQTSLQYDPEILEKDFLVLEVYFPSKPSKDFFETLEKSFPGISFTSFEEQQKDWNEEWKKGFEEFELVPGIWVVPSWRTPPKQATIFLSIDPGLAFGTGTHETTQLASQALSEITKNFPTGFHALDVGTGTGILAMLSAYLGADRVVGTEIDEMAREVAKENIQRNGLNGNVEIANYQVQHVDEKFSLVIANIIDGVLLNIQKELNRCLTPGGILLLTGILKEREDYFREHYQLPLGYEWKLRWMKNEWVALMGGPK